MLIRRTLKFTSIGDRPGVVFRVATGQDIIVTEDDRTFLIGKSLRIRIDDNHIGQIVKTPAGPQLRILLDIEFGRQTLVIEYAW